MKELLKEILAKIFHIETYRDLVEYLLQENLRLEKELADIKEYVSVLVEDIEEIDLEEFENETD